MPLPVDTDDPVVSPRLGAGRLPALRSTPPLLDPTVEPVPIERRLPAHKGKLDRITDHLAGLSEDVREVVELRIQLVKREVMEQIEGRLSSVKGQVVVGAIAAVGGVFLLQALALGAAALFILIGLSRPLAYFLGFLTIALLFFGAAYAAKRKLMPGAVRIEHDKETGKVRLAVEESPAEHERRKAAEEGRPVDTDRTGKDVASTPR